MTLTPSQIEVLARFDGWVWKQDDRWGSHYWKAGNILGTIEQQIQYFISPGVLIEMRLKLIKEAHKAEDYAGVVMLLVQSGDLILSGEYTAAAIKTSEIIQKLEA